MFLDIFNFVPSSGDFSFQTKFHEIILLIRDILTVGFSSTFFILCF